MSSTPARVAALKIAFGTFISNADELIPEKAMRLPDDGTVIHWEPFENYDRDDVRAFINHLADVIEEAIENDRD